MENYRRIKQEEADARAQLMQPKEEISSHHRIVNNVKHKFKPSANALASYSPLRNIATDVTSSHEVAIISEQDLHGLRGL